MVFSQIILEWYYKNKRSLPWRSTQEPYNIWLSEIILQQTRVAQGMPYYIRFIDAYPTVKDLASAKEESILKLWQGLGYYSRARNLHAAAKMVVQDYDGSFPRTYKELRKLKGVGDYTASAIASICYNLPEPVVDGNVYRVLARYYGIDLPINSSKGVSRFKSLARTVMDKKNIRDYNQGIMEFGAMQCVPKNPDCIECPLCSSCVANEKNRVASLPVKLKKTKIRNRYFNYLVLLDKNENTVFRQRKGKGIWQNLWEFPLLESEKPIAYEELQENYSQVLPINGINEIHLFNEVEIVHKLSHQNLHTKFWILKSEEVVNSAISFQSVKEFPQPVLIADFLKTFKN